MKNGHRKSGRKVFDSNGAPEGTRALAELQRLID
jgi:hypothetical protein